MLVNMDDIRAKLRARNFQVENILMILDRDAMTKTNEEQFACFLGRQFVDIPCPYGCCESYSAHYTAEILEVIRQFKVTIDRIEYASEVYKRPQFIKGVSGVVRLWPIIAQILSLYQQAEFQLFYPKCKQCGKLYSSTIASMDKDGTFSYICHDCGFRSGLDNISANGGKIKWKIETPMFWHEFGVSVIFIGTDHLQGNVPCERVFEILYKDSQPPVPYFFSICKDEDQKMMSKSLQVGFQVTKWKEFGHPDELRDFLLSKPPKREIVFHQDMFQLIIKRKDRQA